MHYLYIYVLFILYVYCSSFLEWSYTGENGPDNWHRCYPVAASDYQSPINIEYRNLVYDSSLKRLIFKGYDDSTSTKKIKMKNDGYSVKVRVLKTTAVACKFTKNALKC